VLHCSIFRGLYRPASESESEREFVQVGASEILFSLSLSEKISARCSRVASDYIVTCTVRTIVADAQSGQTLQLEITAYLGPVAV